MSVQTERIQRAKDRLLEDLTETQKRQYEKYGIIKVLGADGLVYFVASEEACRKDNLARITRSDGNPYCVDISAISHEKVLILKKVLETNPSIAVGLVDFNQLNNLGYGSPVAEQVTGSSLNENDPLYNPLIYTPMPERREIV